MSRVAIKICGVKTAEAIDAAVRGGASHVGLNYFPPSPRYLAPDRVSLIAARVPAHVKRVGVLVDPSDDLIDTLVAAGGMEIAQLHGRETPERAAAIRQRTGLQVWKVISVKTAADLATGAAYAGAADFLLYDAKTPDGAALPGGMGLRFDWRLLAGHRPPLRWGLSGGLDAENVADAIRLTGAPLVDVSSGIESAPGVKDVAKIANFCRAAQAS
ncbi:phosphoribosylanthranilate isomerase [Sphingobium sp. B2D3A]|uniref:phosphoribosylanthranilate isomerase n=1 Tax=unclassified Sphingobium TaxID=2611147 RepID=UPI002224D5F1|nr:MULTISPECIES: phosphoribosylanthranilate isomerase [unclassified Sphingobium]MCW2338766.1 phosphoribosylanthranilate isomerase [Sphingobium sp. B2D3A]MCW2367075.1 phosphoribosylanthranilate isomerase [Sphingobium sp. B7D2B]MCW2385224.1 phosphoribosylanthranilate isomerase [Sphingobium sp. B2D3D]